MTIPPFARTRRMGADTAGRTDAFTRGNRMGADTAGSTDAFTRASRMGHPVDCLDFLYATLDRTTCAPSFRERRMKCREFTRLHRKSGLVEGIEPKSALFSPFSCRRQASLLKSETWATHSKRSIRASHTRYPVEPAVTGRGTSASILNQANICTVHDIGEQGSPRRRRRVCGVVGGVGVCDVVHVTVTVLSSTGFPFAVCDPVKPLFTLARTTRGVERLVKMRRKALPARAL